MHGADTGPDPRWWFLLLTPAQLTGIMLGGHDVVAGPVLPRDDATFADADAARDRFGHATPTVGAGRFADFLLLPELRGVHVDADEESPTGWTLRATRTPSHAELWRLEADGQRILITFYDTPAFGWRNGRGPVRPAPTPGLRARWQGLDLVAAVEPGVEGVHLVAVGEEPPEGFAWTKLGVSRRTVGLDEVELYES